MKLAEKLDLIHARVKRNKWYRYFAVFNRLALAAGFIPSGMVKIMGERFTALPEIHPMGSYLTALFHTGPYYTFIGVIQVLAALLLLIPRTATLGAFLYFPIILNICVLSLAVRFDGSIFTSPLMVLANLYLLAYDFDKWKFVLPFKRKPVPLSLPESAGPADRFPFKFFAGVFAVFLMVMAVSTSMLAPYPRNSLKECQNQCAAASDEANCEAFCACVHETGAPLSDCLKIYEGKSP